MLTKGLKKTKAKAFTFLYGEKETDYPGISKNGGKLMEKIPLAWDEFIDKLKKKGLKPAKMNREVYHAWYGPESSENLTELQVQVK